MLLKSLAAIGSMAVTVVVLTSGGAADAMSLKDAVALAVSTNPEVGSIANNRRAVNQELRQGHALFYPQLDLQADAGPEYSDNSNVEATGRDDRTLFRKRASLTLSQLLFDGGFAANEVERQKARVRSAANRVEETAEFVALDAVEAYLEVLRQRERVRIAEDNVAAHRDILSLVGRRAKAGGGGIAEVRQTEARLAAAQSTLVQARGDLSDAEALFLRVVGQAPDTLTEPTPPVNRTPASIEDAVALAVENSPTIDFARADVAAAEAEADQARSSLYPDFRLELGGTAQDNIEGQTDTEYSASALVVMRWNLYRGGADEARIRELKYRLAEAADKLRTSEREISEDARNSWNALQESGENVDVLEDRVEASQRTRDVYRQQFDIGQRGLLDLLDSDNELFLARDSLVTARYAEIFALYRLLATAGMLLDTLEVPAPEAASVAG